MRTIKDVIKSSSFWFFIVSVAMVIVQLFCLSKFVIDAWNFNYNDVAYKLYSFFTAVADAILILLLYWLVPRRRGAVAIALVTIMMLWCVIQVLYQPTYHDIMPWNAFTYVRNISPILIKSALGEFRAAHLVLAMPLLFTVMTYVIWYRRRIARERIGTRVRLVMAMMCVVTYVVLRGVLLFYPYPVLNDSASPTSRLKGYSQLMGSHNRYYMKYGFVAYAMHAAINGVLSSRTLSSDERNSVRQYLDDMPHYTDNIYGNPGKNLILIIVESLNAWVINLEVDGQPVTPVLNTLCADSTAVVSLHMKTQVKNGHSSDGHFMYNTGLLPLTSESVAMNYGDLDFPALAKALKGYDCFEQVCDYPSMWNQQDTYRSYGYDRIYSFADLEPQLERFDYVVDRVLLHQAPERMKKARKPFFAQLVTLNMHSPYDKLQYVNPGRISESNAYTAAVRNYLEVTAVFDAALGDFLARLKQEGLYDNSIIVIASDHTERVDDDPSGRASLSVEGDDCVFVALNTGHGTNIDGVMGQVDVFPTILDLMGANAYHWKGLGHSVMRDRPCAAALDGEVVKGVATPQQAEHLKQAWQISNLMITRNYFQKMP